MLVVTFKYDGNVDVITIVFLSLQMGGFHCFHRNSYLYQT